MSENHIYKIGDIINLEYGKSLKDYRSGEGKYDVFGTNGKIGLTDEFLYNEPSVIIGRKGAYREVHLAKSPFFVIDTAFYTKRKIEDLDNLYLYFWFKNININDMDSGSAIPSTSRDEVYNLDIDLPPLPEQRAIAGVLSNLDDKIDLLHRQNKTLEAMAETLFRQWFVEEADEGWEEGKLELIMKLSNGKSRPNSSGLIPVYGGNGILDYTDQSNYEDESIIIGRVGAYCGSLFFENNKIWVSDNALHAKARNNQENYFLFYLLKTLDLNSFAEGSSHPLLTQTLLNSIDITIPPAERRQEFNTLSKMLNSKTISNQIQIRTLEALRNTLLPKLMSGEVRVGENKGVSNA